MHDSLDHLLRSYSNAIGNRSFQRLSKFADRIYWPDITPSKLTFIASYTPSHICTGRVLHEHSMSIVPALPTDSAPSLPPSVRRLDTIRNLVKRARESGVLTQSWTSQHTV
jgi:hypothetical protein